MYSSNKGFTIVRRFSLVMVTYENALKSEYDGNISAIVKFFFTNRIKTV